MKLITRDHYLNKLIDVKNTPDIKVISGVRRSGKSKLMDAFFDILEKEENANVIRIKLNLKEFEKLKDPEELYKYVQNNYKKEYTNYLLVDEIQLCKDFQVTINSLHEEEKFDIYLTGSNAFLLSSDLATLFGGRVFDISMFPFSFEEYNLYYPSNDIDNFNQIVFLYVDVATKQEVIDLIKEIEKLPFVESAGPNYIEHVE